jgi:NTP pyrophosphatase (non-canonical NTP hydrolase)
MTDQIRDPDKTPETPSEPPNPMRRFSSNLANRAKGFDEEVIALSDLKALREYSLSDPTGVRIGKRWRANLHFGREGIEPEWVICEYVAIAGQPDRAAIKRSWAMREPGVVWRGDLRMLAETESQGTYDKAPKLGQNAPSFGACDLAELQNRVGVWMAQVFGPTVAGDTHERGLRLLEEAIELAQALKVSQQNAHRLVDYIFDRPAGEPAQEMGGVFVTLAATADAVGVSLAHAAAREVDRIEQPVIRAKVLARRAEKRQVVTPKGSDK